MVMRSQQWMTSGFEDYCWAEKYFPLKLRKVFDSFDDELESLFQRVDLYLRWDIFYYKSKSIFKFLNL